MLEHTVGELSSIEHLNRGLEKRLEFLHSSRETNCSSRYSEWGQASRIKTRYDSFVATDAHCAITPGESTDAPAQPPLTPRARGGAPA